MYLIWPALSAPKARADLPSSRTKYFSATSTHLCPLIWSVPSGLLATVYTLDTEARGQLWHQMSHAYRPTNGCARAAKLAEATGIGKRVEESVKKRSSSDHLSQSPIFARSP